jgi:hypothetical protein
MTLGELSTDSITPVSRGWVEPSFASASLFCKKRLARDIAEHPILMDAWQFFVRACQLWDVVSFLGV